MSALSTVRDTLRRHRLIDKFPLATVSPWVCACGFEPPGPHPLDSQAAHQASHVLADLAREDVVALAGGIDLEEMVRKTKATGIREAADAMPVHFEAASSWAHWYADSVETEAEAGESS